MPMLFVLLCMMLASAPARAADASPEAIEGWLDSVVMLITGPSWCSGVVIDDKGTIATAHHCVANGRRPKVITRDGTETVGRTRAELPSEDLALIQADELAGKIKPLQIRGEVPLRGTRVYGLGHPFAPLADRKTAMTGMLRWSVTEGVVSATGPHLLQTDAALNPGMSGGPVVDADGAIVGITSRKLGNGENISFVAASAQLQGMVDDPKKPSLWGGQLQIGLSWIAGTELSATQTTELLGQAVIRDRLVASVGLCLPPSRLAAIEAGTVWAPSTEFSAALRQRIGRGNWSTTIDLGGGHYTLVGLESTFDAEQGRWWTTEAPPSAAMGLYGRVGLSGFGLRVIQLWTEPQPNWLIAFDLDIPGVLDTF